jgi:peptidoglycan/LPS O-acetylase OafA/YrhL
MGAVRLFLALVVANDHWRALPLDPRHVGMTSYAQLRFNAGYAVMFFYVISGFLITYALAGNYTPDASGARRFYCNRFVRIFSVYWPAVLLSFITVSGAWTEFAEAGIADKFTSIFLLGMDWRVAFASYPAQHWGAAVAGLRQAWTLGAEFAFYLFAPLLMRSWTWAAAILAASVATRYATVSETAVGLDEVWTYQIIGSTMCFCMMGHLSCMASRRWPRLAHAKVGLSLTAANALVMFLAPDHGFDTPRFWLSITLFATGLPGLFSATKDARWMNMLGDLSYLLYLVHRLVFLWIGDALAEATFSRLGTRLIVAHLSALAFLGATLLATILVHAAIEKPIVRTLRRPAADRAIAS